MTRRTIWWQTRMLFLKCISGQPDSYILRVGREKQWDISDLIPLSLFSWQWELDEKTGLQGGLVKSFVCDWVVAELCFALPQLVLLVYMPLGCVWTRPPSNQKQTKFQSWHRYWQTPFLYSGSRAQQYAADVAHWMTDAFKISCKTGFGISQVKLNKNMCYFTVCGL